VWLACSSHVVLSSTINLEIKLLAAALNQSAEGERLENWHIERRELLTQNKEAKAKLESIVMRLKAMNEA